MSDRHTVLLIEDDVDYARMVGTVLDGPKPAFLNGRCFEVVHVYRLSEGLERLAEGGVDIVLLDLTLPDSHGLDTLVRLRRQAPDVPVVVLTCVEDEALIVRAAREGAQDYLVKGRTHSSVLARAVWYALERHRLQSRRNRAGETRFRGIIENTADGIVVVNREGIVRFVNPAAQALFGRPANELVGEMMGFPIVAGETTELDIIQKGGKRLVAEMRATETVWRDESVYLASLRDITDRKRVEEALQASERRFKELADSIADVFFAMDADFRYTYWNRASEELTSVPATDALGKSLYELFPNIRDSRAEELYLETLRTRQARSITTEYVLHGEQRVFELTACPSGDGLTVLAKDVTERRRAEKVLRETEEQLRQSQKLEAIGRLAGGMAHDFNNLLTIITGYSELVLKSLDEGDPVRKDIEGIERAGERAAALVAQLLAFSRRQVLQPKVLDLNDLVVDTGKMLRPLIGEDIELSTKLACGLGRVKVDPGQIQQVIVNLAVNSRDAMPEGGKLIIETRHVELDEAYVQRRSVVQPGSYVMLAVSDTGAGMDEETQAHIFEPFFTTKEQGKGTGLGLSTVYGIVKQSGGYVWAYSELGKGTTFKVYLPRLKGEMESDKTEVVPAVPRRGTESILLVEDEEAVRWVAQRALRINGYTVLEAQDPADALRICEEHDGQISLILTDVVMPETGGPELARRLAPLRPGMRVLYMSGYTEEAIAGHGVIDPGAAFIQKPFSPDGLARKVREVLDAPREEMR